MLYVRVLLATTFTLAAVDANVVVLRNTNWDAVNVEVRRGNDDDCGLNAAFETKKLFRNETWEVPAPDVSVCYRRDVNPNRMLKNGS
jgi:hypothetical protein